MNKKEKERELWTRILKPACFGSKEPLFPGCGRKGACPYGLDTECGSNAFADLFNTMVDLSDVMTEFDDVLKKAMRDAKKKGRRVLE